MEHMGGHRICDENLNSTIPLIRLECSEHVESSIETMHLGRPKPCRAEEVIHASLCNGNNEWVSDLNFSSFIVSLLLQIWFTVDLGIYSKNVVADAASSLKAGWFGYGKRTHTGHQA